MKQVSPDSGCRVTIVSIYNMENTSIRYFIPILRQAGHTVQVVYFQDYYVNDAVSHTRTQEDMFIDVIKGFNPDIVAFSVISSTFFPVTRDLTELVTEKIGALTIWGGVHAMVNPDQGIEIADCVCLGEGEYPLLDLANAIARGESHDAIPNLWVKTPDGIRKNPVRPMIENLAELPLPDYSDDNKYYIKDKVYTGDPFKEFNWQYFVHASRGCPLSCSYCMNSVLKPIFGSGRLRKRPVESVVAELEYVRETLPLVGSIWFIDEAFLTNDDWIDEFVQLYPKRVGLPFGISNIPGFIKAKHLTKLKKAGLFEVDMGIQSGSQKVRYEIFNRRVSTEDILNAAQAVHECGIDLKVDLIFDNPYETEEDKQELFELLMKMQPPFEFCIFSLTWFPGVPLTQRALADGIITEEQLEDRAGKAKEQWAITMDFPRSRDEQFWISICMLTGKPWFPRPLIRWLSTKKIVREKPGILQPIIRVNTLIRWILKGIPVLLKGQVPWTLVRKRWRFMLKAVK